ncbi:ribose transporter permease RbsC [Mycolicibacterium mageritense DSM 44476 = CIP 104973]|uniref:Ribonucleotide-diphosphate reductase subunit alpha n=1 Tax=Mycolicibacterium mageritense TaxID=53462 RepID=A0ABN5Y5R2_MYCME|nr:ABC transporter permease [Mycolicibacterium mageritense]MCC9180663.1 ABC transporter permease [Mycolicibacterium mageritense]TXI61340.1 MAG: ABC transporter permease [Mycolicibacterium mageritense]CDO23040.1 ribose transporter permease RbsC [Mycolicibacterium mageritense DSM 44476 = CIP 104973]BBX32419.1 ribonucleotide-diphosphate reductase subunit alpha [Mycolicibacterium mageritense]GJJ21256.1 ribonucleotide-diphosphate reductase subunit alpha [Mycolicibacterium mageritense]
MITTSTQPQPDVTAAPVPRRRTLGGYNLRQLAQLGPVVALLALAVFFAIAAPNFTTGSNLTNVLQQVSITAVAAVGATVVILVAGIDLSVGSIVALTGSIAALYLQHAILSTGASAAVAVLVSLVVGTACGFLNGLLVTVAKVPAFIATLATLTALRGIALLVTNSYPISIKNPAFTDIGIGKIGAVPIPVIIMAVTFAVGYVILHRLKIGRRIYAVGGNREAARLSGIRVSRVLLFAFTFAGLCAGVASVILTAKLSSGQPAGAVGFELDVIAAVVVGGTSLFGGRGRLTGTFLGALIIAVLGNGLTLMNVPFYWQQIVTGAVVVGAVVLDRVTRGEPGE